MTGAMDDNAMDDRGAYASHWLSGLLWALSKPWLAEALNNYYRP